MKETPIIFTPENIRAIIEGRKTQTRRVIKSQPSNDWHPDPVGWYAPTVTDKHGEEGPGKDVYGASDEDEGRISPYGGPGDKLYVKEGVIIHNDGRTLAGYYMDGARVTNLGESRRTAMFMPKHMARYWLEITDVRVEQLQNISDEDCFAEGIHRFGSTEMYGHNPKGTPGPLVGDTPKDAYRLLWDSINRKKHSWSSNPWVWIVEFKLLAKARNIQAAKHQDLVPATAVQRLEEYEQT